MSEKAIVEKIRKLFKLAGNNSSAAEAESAALKAQALIAKHGFSIAEINEAEDEDKIGIAMSSTGNGRAWKYQLAHVVSDNFRCKHYWIGRHQVAFYGYESDCVAASEVFAFLFKMGHRLADKEVHRCYAVNRSTKGVYQSYVRGFVNGLSAKLAEQCKALMLIISEEVVKTYEDHTKNFSTIKTSTRASNMDINAYKKGYAEGASALARRELKA